MGQITIDGTEYEIERMSRDRFPPIYTLRISLSNVNQVDIPKHERERILDCGSRRDLTDELLRDEIEKFINKYPDADVNGFGVIEEYPARESTHIKEQQHQ